MRTVGRSGQNLMALAIRFWKSCTRAGSFPRTAGSGAVATVAPLSSMAVRRFSTAFVTTRSSGMLW